MILTSQQHVKDERWLRSGLYLTFALLELVEGHRAVLGAHGDAPRVRAVAEHAEPARATTTRA